MADPFQYDGPGMTGPCRNAAAVTPDDDTDLTTIPRALFIGTGGDVKVDCRDSGTAVTFKNLANGSYLLVVPTRVYATDTSATDIVAIW